MNVQPYILLEGIEARHADLVRSADAERLARASRRPRLLGLLGLVVAEVQHRVRRKPVLEHVVAADGLVEARGSVILRRP
jgi:hypothetical protein